MDKNAIYQKLPVPLQNIACSAEGARLEKVRYGNVYKECAELYSRTKDLKGNDLKAYQNERLCKMIDHCYYTVPYYTKLFSDLGITNNDIRTVEELEKLPILTRGGVKQNQELLISTAIPQNQRYIHNTGGTSGAGLKFWTTHEEDSEQWAVWWRYRNGIGIERNQWCGLFGGKVIVPLSMQDKPFWRTNHPGKQVFFSAYHLNENTVSDYADALEKIRIKWIHGYPTVIAEFARLLILKNRRLEMRYVTVGSENLTDNHITAIEKAFGVEPFQHYGLTEGVANISQDSEHKLRVDEDFSYVEFVESNNGNRIIGTTFSNYAMPLLRYDTGDFGELSKENDEGIRIVERISGRASEYIRKEDGNIITSAAISLIFNSFDEITQAQLLKKKDGSIDVNIVLMGGFSQSREEILSEKLTERLGTTIFRINKVEKLQKTKSGKTKLIINEQ